MTDAHTMLWRPVGVYELRLVAEANFAAFPPRLPEQPIFYPVCNQGYAEEIARKWNIGDPNSGYAGFVTQFSVPTEVAERFPKRVVGAARHEELWVPAADLRDFCAAFAEPIAVVRGWIGPQFPEVCAWSGPFGEVADDDLARVVTHIAVEELVGGPLTRQEGLSDSE